jgi:hypothetical protein
MVAPQTFTPQMERVRQLADKAKESSEGVRVFFRASALGSFDAAKSAAHGIQTAFSALRARERRKAQRCNGESDLVLDPNTRGPYCGIACVKRPLPNREGFSIEFVPEFAHAQDLEVVDIASGQPLASEDPLLSRLAMLLARHDIALRAAIKDKRTYFCPLNPEEMDFCWRVDAEACEWAKLPKLTQEGFDSPSPDRPYASVDLASLSDEELGFGEEEEG